METFLQLVNCLPGAEFLLLSVILNKQPKETAMVCEVKLYVAGKVFYETVHARDYQEAKQVALARNPNAQVVSVNAKF